MSERAFATAGLFSEALGNLSPRLAEDQRLARQLLGSTDPFARVTPIGLLGEAAGRFLAEAPHPVRPLTLFMDRLGGGEGARACSSLIALVGERWPRGALVHVAFATPSRGLGALVRGNLTRAGADSKVVVDVVAYNRPVEGLHLSPNDADRLVEGCDLVVTYAAGGVAGLMRGPEERDRDLLLARSHVAICSFPDPEASVAELPSLAEVVLREPGIDAIRFRVEVEADGRFEELGHALLSEQGDAQERLWVLLDNARRRRYRVVVEPMLGDLPAGHPIVCPCQTVIQAGLLPELVVVRVVKAGSRLVVVGRGRDTRS
jgi:hypothetical protein